MRAYVHACVDLTIPDKFCLKQIAETPPPPMVVVVRLSYSQTQRADEGNREGCKDSPNQVGVGAELYSWIFLFDFFSQNHGAFPKIHRPK